MNIVLDILLVLFLALGAYLGFRKGLLKTLIGFIGLIAILIISYALRAPLANFLIDKLPFFEFGGAFAGLSTLNILIYNIIAFVVVFIVLYCLLNIIIAVTGFIDALLKLTVIWAIPSKIGGAIVGFLEAWVFAYLILFIFVQFNFSYAFINNCKGASIILDHTPIVGTYLGGARSAASRIYNTVKEYEGNEEKTTKDLNIAILHIERDCGLISKDKVNELIETGKLGFDGVMFGL